MTERKYTVEIVETTCYRGWMASEQGTTYSIAEVGSAKEGWYNDRNYDIATTVLGTVVMDDWDGSDNNVNVDGNWYCITEVDVDSETVTLSDEWGYRVVIPLGKVG